MLYSSNDDGEKKKGKRKNVAHERMSYEIIIVFKGGGAAASHLLSKSRIDVTLCELQKPTEKSTFVGNSIIHFILKLSWSLKINLLSALTFKYHWIIDSHDSLKKV